MLHICVSLLCLNCLVHWLDTPTMGWNHILSSIFSTFFAFTFLWIFSLMLVLHIVLSNSEEFYFWKNFNPAWHFYILNQFITLCGFKDTDEIRYSLMSIRQNYNFDICKPWYDMILFEYFWGFTRICSTWSENCFCFDFHISAEQFCDHVLQILVNRQKFSNN